MFFENAFIQVFSTLIRQQQTAHSCDKKEVGAHKMFLLDNVFNQGMKKAIGVVDK
jgi:hypothetical protein